MTNITVVSEPLIEEFGRGFTDQDVKPETPCSGDALNMAMAIQRMLPHLAKHQGQQEGENHISVLCGLGDDQHGKTILQFMQDEGLNTKHTMVLGGRDTASYTIHREEGGTKRSVEYANRGPESAMCQLLEDGGHKQNVGEMLGDIGNNTDVLVITGIGASRARSDQAFRKLVDTARDVKEHGGQVIVDFNHRYNADTGEAKLWVSDDGNPLPNNVVRERMDQLFALSDVAFVAHDELWPVYPNVFDPPLAKGQEPTDGKPIAEYLMNLSEAGSDGKTRDVFFKRGKDGGTLYQKDAEGKLETFRTNNTPTIVTDRNGGGDGLIGGTIAALASGYPLKDALNIGQRTAAQVVQHTGGVIRKDYLPTELMLDGATGEAEKRFAGNQTKLEESLAQQPFVPVFQLTTHDGNNTILEDAESKVAAMHKGGIKQFEFLLRGDTTMSLDQYVDESLAAIDKLAAQYPDATFGVGTVSSPERMLKAVSNPNVSFIVTAHWPGEDMIKMATRHGKPIIPTASHTESVGFKEDGKIAAPGSEGADTLNPERIKQLRDMCVDTVKIFNFGSIAKKRAEQQPKVNANDDTTFIAAGLTAIAEAIRDSYDDGKVPTDKKFTVMTTGGVTPTNLPFLVAGAKSTKVKEKISKLVGDTQAAQPLIDILANTTVVAGGTFITKSYDKTDDVDQAQRELESLSSDVVSTVEKAQAGVISQNQI